VRAADGGTTHQQNKNHVAYFLVGNGGIVPYLAAFFPERRCFNFA